MPILKILPNQPYNLSLKYPKPTQKNGQWGKQFEYITSDGKIFYVPPIAHAEIQALNPAAGEPFTLLKKIERGNAAVWTVERIQQPANGHQPQPKPVTAARTITGAVPVPPSLTTAESRRIFAQLVATIQATQAAEEFAKSIGREIRFDAADIRSMAISGFIEQSRRAA